MIPIGAALCLTSSQVTSENSNSQENSQKSPTFDLHLVVMARRKSRSKLAEF